jgi:photosystem II stability/assembly factor-like uncharacterized protein
LPPGSKETGGFVLALIYTQRFVGQLTVRLENSTVTGRRFALAFVSLLFGLLASAQLFGRPDTAKQVDPKLFQELRWRLIGPFRGGRTLAVTGVRGKPEVFYFGSVGGGVWKTDDAGRTWKPIFDSQPIGSIGAIAVAPSDSNVIYVGSGEADMRNSISYGNGMYKSADGGKTWTHIGLGDSRQIGRILVDPRDANKVFVAALGHAYGPNAERGVFRSNDGGKNWQKILFHDENTGAIDLAFEPGNTKTIYAALWQTRRPPWNIYPPSNGPGSGLYRSKDGGDHWEQVTGHGLPSDGLGRIGIAFAPSSPRRIYLIVDAKEGGLYRSDDSGQNWQHLSKDKRVWQRGWYFGEVSVDPRDPETVYLPNTAMYKSRDGGKTFTAFRGAPGGDDYHALWIDPDEPQRMALSSDQGTLVTRNGGETWSSWYNQPTGQFYHVITDNRFPYWVYGAQQDSGAAATPSRSMYRSLNFHDWRMDTSRRTRCIREWSMEGLSHGRILATSKCNRCRRRLCIRASTGARGRCLWCFRRSTSMCCTSGRRCCFERRTAGIRGRSSARISRAKIRERRRIWTQRRWRMLQRENGAG